MPLQMALTDISSPRRDPTPDPFQQLFEAIIILYIGSSLLWAILWSCCCHIYRIYSLILENFGYVEHFRWNKILWDKESSWQHKHSGGHWTLWTSSRTRHIWKLLVWGIYVAFLVSGLVLLTKIRPALLYFNNPLLTCPMYSLHFEPMKKYKMYYNCTTRRAAYRICLLRSPLALISVTQGWIKVKNN